jgi:hypothetical protein
MRQRPQAVTDLVVARRHDPRAEPDAPDARAPDDTRTDDPEGLPMRYHHLARVGLVKRVMMAERPGPMRVVAREDDSAVRRDRRAG